MLSIVTFLLFPLQMQCVESFIFCLIVRVCNFVHIGSVLFTIKFVLLLYLSTGTL